jgi:hypothetical protein
VVEEIVSREDAIRVENYARSDAIEPERGEIALGCAQALGQDSGEGTFFV